ncbi:hypothetical protein BXZ70DRAFT_920981 [Cristinia sonorae]|uniref:pH-response transcription factor pacC/RIM101 n=1 Tax=Cristinia sonorae TaxID=1940300 RepID=A0A8K0XU22_9AGAR|nr:hypothetical protein BXZ70DRAFT_920981 [Cristinia sonorae]
MSQRPRGVSLPGIQEMFPEHLMQQWYSDKPGRSDRHTSSAHSTSSSKPIQPCGEAPSTYGHPVAPCDFAQPQFQLPALPHGRGVTSGEPLESDLRRHHVQTRRHSQPEPGPSHARLGREPYAFDVLRSNPLTANGVMSASEPRAPSKFPAAEIQNQAAEPTIASMRKVRPTFRVQQAKYPSPTEASFPPSNVPKPVVNNPTSNGAGSSSAPHMVSFHPPEPLDDRRHCCPHCDKRFNRPSSLNIHVNTHTGAKPFQCEYPGCKRKFNVNSNMRRHWRNHMSRKREGPGVTAMTRMIQPTSATPTGSHYLPPLTYTPLHKENNRVSPSVESHSSSSASSGSRSPSPPSPCLSDYRNDAHMDSHRDPLRSPWSESSQTARLSLSPAISFDTASGRSRSGSYSSTTTMGTGNTTTTAPYSDTVAVRQHHGDVLGYVGGRPRSCSMAGCDCHPMTSSLRPAFPDTAKR